MEGQPLEVISIGQGDTEHSTILRIPAIGAVVGGDVVYNQVHMMTAETDEPRREDWIASLAQIAATTHASSGSAPARPSRSASRPNDLI